jgi:hypothetical protein
VLVESNVRAVGDHLRRKLAPDVVGAV